MKYYTDTISVTLAEKLKEKGMPIHIFEDFYDKNGPVCLPPYYCEVFDWLMEKGWLAAIGREYDFANELVTERFEWGLEKVGCFSEHPEDGSGFCDTWREAAERAIEKALTLI